MSGTDELPDPPQRAVHRQDGTLLVIDYTGRRVEAPVSALKLDDEGYRVEYLLDLPNPTELTAAGYAKALRQGRGFADEDVQGVLAYCMAAPIAQELAAAVSAATDQPVPLVVFDGAPATAEAVNSEYQLARAKMWAFAADAPYDHHPGEVFSEDELRSSSSAVVERMRAGLRESAERAARSDGARSDIDEDEAEYLIEVFIDWLVHLVAAHNAAWSQWPGPLFQIVSRDTDAVDDWPGATGVQVLRMSSSRRDLLRDPQVRAAVLSFLSSATRKAVV
ncbi:hypothetical protein [Micromonospora sp. WMMA1976]|uniref:hypothetical protein n=1 Tax=Micromonospora sp. WMMA1976 TaxID=3014995 RepID=UPI00248C80C2|nr:hypothetical protein [Micromonospora sp. WMMA1976]WBC01112.1 hypothetical protein O7546_18265 [Micromonospora sp. WMMA1976]